MMHFLALAVALISGKAFKCMRLGPLAGLALWSTLGLGATHANAASAVVIDDSERSFINAHAHYWHEKPAKATIDQASAMSAAAQFAPLNDEKMFNLMPLDRLWVRLDIERLSSIDHAIVWLPLPLLDSVTLYQPSPDGKWKAVQAGDRLAVATWPEPGRYPRFHVELPMGKSSVYLQVQGSTQLSLPIYLGSEVRAQTMDRQGFLAMGLIIGVLLTLVVMCLVTAYTYNDRLYLLYGLYMLVMILAVGAYTGLSAYLLWDRSPVWADASPGALAMLAGGGALYFVEALLAGRQFARKLSGLLLSLAALSLPLAVIYCIVPRSVGVIMLGAYMMGITTIGLALATQAWRHGDQVGKWVFIAYAPLALAMLMAVARAYGWISVSWVVQYGVVTALLIEAPMMMAALNVRSRQRHEIRTREQTMTTQDALTGLLAEHIFDDRIHRTLARSVKRREDAAIVLISLVNYEYIAAAHGLPMAEQSVMRAVIKLRKVLRDVETVARVGTSHFGLILEGFNHRSRVTEVGARLIAQGLMPLPGLVPEVTLQFHLAAVVLSEVPSANRDIKQSLFGLLKVMSPRTRRPIRFLECTSAGSGPRGSLAGNVTAVSGDLTEKIHADQRHTTTGTVIDNSDEETQPHGSEWPSTDAFDSSLQDAQVDTQVRKRVEN